MEQGDNKFKLILTGVFGFFILLGLVAFASFKSSSSTATSVDINVWGTVDQTTFDNFVSTYKQQQNIDFKLTYTQKDPTTINSDVVEAIASGKQPDVVLVPQTLMKYYLDKITPITSIPVRTFEDTYVQEADMYVQPDGSIFGIPFFVDPLVMYWNKDSFTSAGIATPPTQWSQFPLLASKLSQSDGSANIIKSVAPLGEYRNVNNAKGLLSALIMQAGSPIVSVDQNGNYISALYNKTSDTVMIPAVSALSFYTDYSNPQKSVYSWNRSISSSKDFFLAGNLATYFGLASEFSDIQDKNPNLNFDIAPLPQTVDAQAKITYGDLYGFAFLKSSPNTAAAYSLITMLADAPGVNTFLGLTNAAPARTDIIAAGTTDPNKTIFYNSALIARGWVDPDPAQTDQLLQTMVEDVTTGKSDVDSAVQKASLQLDNLLQ